MDDDLAFCLGGELEAAGEPALARRWHEAAANAGSSFARARLGSLAELAGDALGAEIAWREAARKSGHHLAMFALGETLLGQEGGDARARRVARAWLALASRRGGGVAEAAEAPRRGRRLGAARRGGLRRRRPAKNASSQRRRRGGRETERGGRAGALTRVEPGSRDARVRREAPSLSASSSAPFAMRKSATSSKPYAHA